MKYSILIGLISIICILCYIINTIENVSKLKENFINSDVIEHQTQQCRNLYAKEGVLKDIGTNPERNWSNVTNMIKKYESYEPKNYNAKCKGERKDSGSDTDTDTDTDDDDDDDHKLENKLKDKLSRLNWKLNHLHGKNKGFSDNILGEIALLKEEMKLMFASREDAASSRQGEITNHREYAAALEKELEDRRDGKHRYKRIPEIESNIRDNYTAREDSIDKVDNIYENEYKFNRMGSRCPLLDKDASDEMKELGVACAGGLNNFIGLLPENQVGFTYMNPDYWTVPKRAYNQCPPGHPPSAVFDTGTPLNALDLTRVGSILPKFKYKEDGYIDARTANMKAADRISKDKDEFAGYSFSGLDSKASGGFAKAFPDKRFKILEDYKCNLDSSYLRGMTDDDNDSTPGEADMYYKDKHSSGDIVCDKEGCRRKPVDTGDEHHGKHHSKHGKHGKHHGKHHGSKGKHHDKHHAGTHHGKHHGSKGKHHAGTHHTDKHHAGTHHTDKHHAGTHHTDTHGKHSSKHDAHTEKHSATHPATTSKSST
jgi:hypothetical protein